MDISAAGRDRLAILVPGVNGHRLMYLRHVLEYRKELGQLGNTTLLIPKGAAYSHEYRIHILANFPGIAVVDHIDFSSEGIAFACAQFAHVLALEGDALLLEIGRTGKWRGPRLTALVMRPTVQPRASRILQAGAAVARALLLGRGALTPRVRRVSLIAPYDVRPRLGHFVIDPVEISERRSPRDEFINSIGGDPSRLWIAVVGSITSRKNPEPVVQAAEAAGRDFGAMIVGPWDPRLRDSRERVIGAGIATLLVDEYVSDAQLDSAIAAADLLVVAQDNRGPSGILAKALALGTPTLVAGPRAFRSAARRYRGNLAWVPNRREAMTAFFRSLPSSWRRPDGVPLDASPREFARKLTGWAE